MRGSGGGGQILGQNVGKTGSGTPERSRERLPRAPERILGLFQGKLSDFGAVLRESREVWGEGSALREGDSEDSEGPEGFLGLLRGIWRVLRGFWGS